MSTLLEAVARTRDARREAEQAFREALRAAHASHSWAELAAVAGLSRAGVRWLAENLNERRKDAERRKRRKAERE